MVFMRISLSPDKLRRHVVNRCLYINYTVTSRFEQILENFAQIYGHGDDLNLNKDL